VQVHTVATVNRMTSKPNTDIPQPEAQKHNASIINHIPGNSTRILQLVNVR